MTDEEFALATDRRSVLHLLDILQLIGPESVNPSVLDIEREMVARHLRNWMDRMNKRLEELR